MSVNKCFKCEIEFEDDERSFECDGCSATWHLKCAGITKQEANIRDKSNRIRLLCDDCNTTDPIGIIANNVKTMMKFIYKIDMTLQNQVMTSANIEDTLTKNTEEIKRIETVINIMKNEVITVAQANTNHSSPTNTSTTVNMVRQPGILPAVVVKPKNDKQTCEATMQKIKQCIGTSGTIVRNTQNIRSGGVVLSCANAGETMKMKQLICDKTGDEYEVLLPSIKRPRVKITKVHSDMNTDEILNDIKNKNENLGEAEIEIKKIIKRRQTNTCDVIAEVDCKSFETMMMKKKLFIGWSRCDVNEHVYLKRCYKCCGFSHIEKECKRVLACSKCAEQHKSTACKSRKFGCINCITANDKYGLSLMTDHHAWSRNCAVLRKRVNGLKEYIQYNPAE